jgi:hypothetical protein
LEKLSENIRTELIINCIKDYKEKYNEIAEPQLESLEKEYAGYYKTAYNTAFITENIVRAPLYLIGIFLLTYFLISFLMRFFNKKV